jgi:hypothetical protein
MLAFRRRLYVSPLLFLVLALTAASQPQNVSPSPVRSDAPHTHMTKSAVKISDIYPGTLRIGEQGTLLITGKHLNQVNFIQLQAMNASMPDSASTPISVSNADETKTNIQHMDDTQMLVHFDLEKIQSADSYMLLFGLGKTGDAPQITAIFPINVFGPATSVASSTSTSTSKTSSAPAGQSPFASCLTSSPSLVESATSQAATGVNCSISILTDHEVSDNFGHHVSTEYYAVQLRVSNQNAQYDFLLRDILITLPDGRVVSGRIKRLAQGVALKGKTEDRRAYWYNGMSAAGTVYGAAVTLPLSVTFKNIGNLFQGPLEAAFGQIWPDYSVDNINRFNNAVFDDQNPSIVSKGSIAQPPLYVVALLPKPDGKSPYKSNYIDMVTFGIEGTFIKQVNTVSLSPGTLSFQPEFISPSSLSQVLGSDVDIDAFENASPAQAITLNNQSSSPINITKVAITSGSSATPSSDFRVASDQSTCGTQKIDATKAFSVPAQQSCQIFIRSTPQSLGATTASLTLEGSNLDTTQVVTLAGTGVGFYLDTATLGSHKTPFQCSLIVGKCTIDLGLVTIPTGSAPLQIKAYIFAATASDSSTCASDTVTLGDSATATHLCTTSTSTLVLPLTKEETPYELTLPLVPAATPIPATFTLGKQTETITFDYQTTETAATISTVTDPQNAPVTAATPVNPGMTLTVTVTATKPPLANGTSPLDGKKAKLSLLQGTTVLTSYEGTIEGGKVTFKPVLPDAPNTHYTLTAIVEESGAYAQSDPSAPFPVSTGDAALNPAPGAASPPANPTAANNTQAASHSAASH